MYWYLFLGNNFIFLLHWGELHINVIALTMAYGKIEQLG